MKIAAQARFYRDVRGCTINSQSGMTNDVKQRGMYSRPLKSPASESPTMCVSAVPLTLQGMTGEIATARGPMAEARNAGGSPDFFI